jgi:hypothetical protein
MLRRQRQLLERTKPNIISLQLQLMVRLLQRAAGLTTEQALLTLLRPQFPSRLGLNMLVQVGRAVEVFQHQAARQLWHSLLTLLPALLGTG